MVAAVTCASILMSSCRGSLQDETRERSKMSPELHQKPKNKTPDATGGTLTLRKLDLWSYTSPNSQQPFSMSHRLSISSPQKGHLKATNQLPGPDQIKAEIAPGMGPWGLLGHEHGEKRRQTNGTNTPCSPPDTLPRIPARNNKKKKRRKENAEKKEKKKKEQTR